MGYISSGGTTNLKVYLTQKGRDYLLNGTQDKYLIKYFSLGDSDTNYFVENRNGNGKIVDLTGDNLDCLQSVTNNSKIKYPLPYATKDAPVIIPTPEIYKKVKLLRLDNNIYQNDIECVINLDKLCRYFLYHASTNKLNPLAKIFDNMKSPIINFYNKANLFDQNDNKLGDLDMDVIPESLAVFKGLSNTFLEISDTNSYINNESLSNPFTFLFSSSADASGARFAGSGKGGLFVSNRDYGYTFRPAANNDINNIFIPSEQMAIKDINIIKNKTSQEVSIGKSNFFTPSVKIRTNLKSDNSLSDLVYRYDITTVTSNYDEGTVEQNFANQYCKAFQDITPYTTNTGIPVISNSEEGLMINEVKNLKNFIESSPYFRIVSGTEYRTDLIGFTVKPKITQTFELPAKIKLVFKFNINEVLKNDSGYDTISDEGDGNFLEYLN